MSLCRRYRLAAGLVIGLTLLVSSSVLAQVARVGAWTTGLTHTVGAGSNRLLVFAAGYENASSTDIGISSVTYGGQALVRIAGESAGTTNRDRAELWYLNAAGIAAATGTTFVVTWTPSTPAQVMYAAATFANVNQTTPIEDRDSTFTNSATPNPITLTMTKSINGMVIGNYACGNTGSYTWNNGFTEGFDQVAGATTTMSGGDQAQTTAGTVVVSATHSGPNRQAVTAASLLPATVDQPPVLATIGPRSVNEGVLLNFNISATDPDGTIPTFTSSTLPTGATLTGNGNGTATFNWTPTFLQSGSYPVTFRATDGTLVDTEIVTITVTNIPQPPVLATIGPRSVNEGANLNFNISATDPDGTIPTFTSSTLPTGATLTGNGNGTATFNWTPTFLQSGSYPVTFRATDGTLVDTEIVTITVTNIPQPPVLATIGPRSVNEGVLLTFNISATDPDGTIPTFTSSTLPTGATLTGNGNGTATFNWTPTILQSGSYPVTFRATDGTLIDTEIVTITVNDVSQPPVLATIGPKSVTEGAHLNFNISATDPDGTTPTFTSSTLPTGATLTGNGNGTATFNWTPSFVQAGVYNIVFRATDGTSVDTEIVPITVNEAGNQPPDLAAIGPKSTNEGVLLTFNISATDPDGTIPTFTSSTLPTGATLTGNGNGTATFNWTPTFLQSGGYPVTFRATDGTLVDTEIVTITVTNIPQPPVLATIGPRSVNEGVLLNFNISATDPDGTIPTFTSSTLPTGATLTGNGNGTATFNWTPTFLQSGSYPVTFRATDGTLIDTEIVTITVNDVSQPPDLAAIGPKSTNEGVLLTFNISATDPDGTIPTFTSSTLPTGATLTGNGNGTATFNWTPTFLQSGSYPVTFRATDGTLVDTEIVTITVTNIPQPPVLATIGPRSVNEGVLLTFNISATDADGTLPTFTSSTLPTGATLTGNGNGTATFNWTPTFLQSGTYLVTFRATDGTLIDTEIVTITVNNVSLPPDLAAIGPKSTNEGVLLTFNISATDPDGTIPTFTSSTLPTGATLTGNGNGTATFNWTPTFLQSGSYPVTFRATDGTLVDTEIVTITVIDVNRPPDQATIGPKSVNEGVLLTFNISATDPDGTIPTFTSSTLPTSATLTGNGNGTATFNWTPTFLQSGSYPVTFRATDGTLVDTEIVTITVTNIPQPPVLATIGPRSVNEGVLLTFNISATDPDGTIPTFTSSTLPTSATLTGNGNGTATFNWTPTFLQSGSYPVTFRATDGTLVDTEIVTITVTDVNRPPDQATIGPKSTNEGVHLNFLVSATDPDGTTPTLTASTLPAGSTYTPNGNGTATFNWTPTFLQSGTYPVTFRATDGTLIDTEIVIITVNNVGQPPDLAAIGPKGTSEGVLLTFNISATDPDGTIPTFTSSTLPTGATLTGNGNGTATFNWTPTFLQSGSYPVTFRATDGTLIDTETVTITVGDVNQPPLWSAAADTVILEGTVLSRVLLATDLDGQVLQLSSALLPANAIFVDSGNGRGQFTFAPSYVQSGLYPFSFFATDGILIDTLSFAVAVSEAGGQAPVFDSIGARTVNEGAVLLVRVVAHDPESTAVTLVASGLPPNAFFVDSGNGVGGLVFTPNFLQAGSFTINILAADLGVPPLTGIQPVSITVLDVNRPPVLDSIGPRFAVIEKAFAIDVTASDSTSLAGNVLLFTTLGLPAGSTFVDSGNGHGRFSWTPTALQVGTHNVTFSVFDNAAPSLNDQEVVQISVMAANRTPVLAAIGPRFVTEGQILQFVISATDADSTIPTFVIVNHPPAATLVDHGNGTATFTYVPQFSEAGLRSVEFRALDPFSFGKEIVLIQVQEAGNQPPEMLVVGPPTAFERDTLTATIRANDPDSTANAVTMISPLPANATFLDHGNGTATFQFVPWYTQQGSYNLRFATSDGSLTDSVTYHFNILDVGNQTPFLHALGSPLLAIPDKTFREELRDSLYVAASDLDSTVVALRATGLPAGATFTDGGNNVGRLAWKPTFSQAGLYQVTIFARDGQDSTRFDSQLVSLTVNNFFPGPVWNPTIVKNHIVAEGTILNLNLASIPIDTIPRFKANHKPANSTLTDNGNGTCNFNFQPSFFQAGVDSAVLIAYHPLDSSVQTPLVLRFTIPNTPQPPIWRPKNDTSITENVQLALIVTADDPDNTVPVLTAQNLPTGATFGIPFQGGGSATGNLSWRPSFAQQGVYLLRFLASDGTGVDTMVVTVTVLEAGNQTPVFTSAPADQTLILPAAYSIRVTAVDADATIPSLRVERIPRNATFVDSGNGSGRFLFIPDSTQTDSVYAVDFFASDGLAQVKITVTYSVFNFIRGDTNRDTQVTSADVIYLVNYVFKGGAPPMPVQAGDLDKSGAINSSDVIYLVNYLFKSGPPPPP